MKYDHVGVELLKTAAFLYAARYVAAALFMGPGLKNWDGNLFHASYNYIGNGLTVWAIISAIVGVVMIVVSLAGKRSGKTDA